MQQQTGALQMPQELVPQARAFGSPLDQARHIGHDKALLGTHPHHAQVGVQGGEGVIGDLGPGIGSPTAHREAETAKAHRG